jgi:hypothetical protein
MAAAITTYTKLFDPSALNQPLSEPVAISLRRVGEFDAIVHFKEIICDWTHDGLPVEQVVLKVDGKRVVTRRRRGLRIR